MHSCRALRQAFSAVPGSDARGSGSGAASSGSNMSAHGIPMEPINIMIRNMYRENLKTMQNSASLPGYFAFHRCITGLMER